MVDRNCILAISGVSNSVNRYLSGALKPYGLPMLQAMVLCQLFHFPNYTATHKELTISFRVRSSTMSSVLHRMGQSGLVKTCENDEDKRLHDIILTPQAVALAPNIESILSEAKTKIKSRISDRQLEAFFQVIDQIEMNLLFDSETDEIQSED